MDEHRKWKYCVVGNIVKERIDENGILRHGTVAFRGGTRVYLEGKYHYGNEIRVLGLNRFGRYAFEYIPLDQIENVRFTRTYKPRIMELMYEYEEFCWWHHSDEDGLDAKQFAANWQRIKDMKGKTDVLMG